jgi:hypothetical protein
MANNKIKVNKNILSRTLMSAISIAVAIAPLVPIHPAQASEWNGVPVCESGPCIRTSDAAQSGDKVIFRWEGDADFYHVRYRSGGAEKQVRNTSRSFTLNKVKPNSTYRLKIQACSSRFLASSKCSPWDEISFTTANPPDPATCKQGYVWREADANDRVCVTPQIRTQTRNENAAAVSRREPNGGPYGPDTCKQGYVWREAIPNDRVCVTPQVRSQAAEDNQRAIDRRIPQG